MKHVQQKKGAVLPLLVHGKNASFEWGKRNVESFIRQARRLEMDVRIMYRWQDALDWMDGNVIIVDGVDKEWLEDTISHLVALQMRVILMDGLLDSAVSQVSQALYPQPEVIRSSLALLKSQGRTRTALFGVQKNDTSDASKAAVFTHMARQSAIYTVETDIDLCFDAFYADIDCYDSVICANDLMAVYLLSRLKEAHIPVPERLHVLGNCDLWISRHVRPMLTTAAYNVDALIAVALRLYQTLIDFPSVTAMNVSLQADILQRDSTGASVCNPNPEHAGRSLYQYDDRFPDNAVGHLCPKIQRLRKLDQILSACTVTDLRILQMLADNAAYDDIARETFLSVDTVKYHIKKLYRLLDIHKRQTLSDLLETYSLKLI